MPRPNFNIAAVKSSAFVAVLDTHIYKFATHVELKEFLTEQPNAQEI